MKKFFHHNRDDFRCSLETAGDIAETPGGKIDEKVRHIAWVVSGVAEESGNDNDGGVYSKHHSSEE